MNWILGGILALYLWILALYLWHRRYQEKSPTKDPATPESTARDGGITVYCDHDTGEIVIEIEEDEGDEVIVFTLEDPETGYAVARAISMAAMRIEAKRAGQAES